MRPQAAAGASCDRLGSFAVSSSERPVAGAGTPPSPSRETRTIFVVFEMTRGAITSSITDSSRLLHGVLDLPEPGDLEPAGVARLEEDRRLAREAHARRRAGRDQVARREGHEVREVADHIADVEDERLG